MKTIITYDHILFGGLTIAVGVKGKRLINFIKKNNKEVYENCFKKSEKEFIEIVDTTEAGKAVLWEENGVKFLFIILTDWKNDWWHYEMLVHEIVHIKQFEWIDRGIGSQEREFEAYYIASLFSKVRKLLMERLEKQEKKKICAKKKKRV